MPEVSQFSVVPAWSFLTEGLLPILEKLTIHLKFVEIRELMSEMMIRELSTETTSSGTRTGFHGRLNLQQLPLNLFGRSPTHKKKAKKADALPNLMGNAVNSEKGVLSRAYPQIVPEFMATIIKWC